MNNVFPGAIQHPTTYFGYPYGGSIRRMRPTILTVEHTTETYSVPFPGPSKSWTFSLERDGTVHQFMDPLIAVPWTNGDIRSPDLSNPLIAAIARQSTYNPNEFIFYTIENVNRIADGQRITAAQLAQGHEIALWARALAKARWGLDLPLVRQEIIGHYQINGETRINCPTVPTDRARVFAGLLGSTLPDAAMEDNRVNIIKDKVRFAQPRQWTVAAGTTLNGYDGKSAAPAKSMPFPSPSGAAAAAVVTISGDAIPAGNVYDYAEVTNGVFAGLYVPVHSISIDQTPDGVSQADIDAAVAAAVKEVPTGITQADYDAGVAAATAAGKAAGAGAEKSRLRTFLGL